MSQLKFYKGNDITTDSIDNFLFNYLKNKNSLIGGKNVLVIGIGNIGFKISLKLVERGANVYIKSREEEKARLISTVINMVKPKETISTVKVFDYKESVQFDAIILTQLKPISENDNVFLNLNNNVLVLDVGKGCLTKNQIEFIKQREVNAFRLDIGDAFVNSIISAIKYPPKFKLPSRKVLNNKICLIEPGIIGSLNEVVVNSIENPDFIYGICDGNGGFKSQINKYEIMKSIKNEHNFNNRL